MTTFFFLSFRSFLNTIRPCLPYRSFFPHYPDLFRSVFIVFSFAVPFYTDHSLAILAIGSVKFPFISPLGYVFVSSFWCGRADLLVPPWLLKHSFEDLPPHISCQNLSCAMFSALPFFAVSFAQKTWPTLRASVLSS